MEQLYK